jgi:hypothetical protein
MHSKASTLILDPVSRPGTFVTMVPPPCGHLPAPARCNSSQVASNGRAGTVARGQQVQHAASSALGTGPSARRWWLGSPTGHWLQPKILSDKNHGPFGPTQPMDSWQRTDCCHCTVTHVCAVVEIMACGRQAPASFSRTVALDEPVLLKCNHKTVLMYQQSANAACNKRIIYKMEHCKRRIIHIHPLQMSLYQACMNLWLMLVHYISYLLFKLMWNPLMHVLCFSLKWKSKKRISEPSVCSVQ